MDGSSFPPYGHYSFDASRRGNEFVPARDEPFAYLHAHNEQMPKISTDSSLAFALGRNAPHVPQPRSASYNLQRVNMQYNSTETFATNDQSMCVESETMSCVVYGEPRHGGNGSSYTNAPFSPSSANYIPDAGYWDNYSGGEYSNDTSTHMSLSNGIDRPFYAPTRSYTLQSAITPVSPPTATSPSPTPSSPSSVSVTSLHAHRSARASSSSTPEGGTARSRPSLAPVMTDFERSPAPTDVASPLSSTTTHTVLDNVPLSLAALASQLDGTGMDELPVSESEARLGQAMFKLHSAVPPPKEQPAKKKPIMACLFCRERKICCGPPPPDCPDQTCKQCSRRGLRCVFPTESRRGQHKRSPRAARVAALADAHLQKLAHAQSQSPGHMSPEATQAALSDSAPAKKRRPTKPRVLKSKAEQTASSPLTGNDSSGGSNLSRESPAV